MGGVYEFGALVDMISGMTAATGSESESGAGIDIAGLLGDVIGLFSTNDIKNEGLTLDVSGVVNMVNNLLKNNETALLAIQSLFGQASINGSSVNVDTMTFKVSDTTFFTDCDKIETASIKNYIARTDAWIDKINEITFPTGSLIKEQGDGIDELYGSKASMKGHKIGTAEDADDIKLNGVLVASSPFDPIKSESKKLRSTSEPKI